MFFVIKNYVFQFELKYLLVRSWILNIIEKCQLFIFLDSIITVKKSIVRDIYFFNEKKKNSTI